MRFIRFVIAERHPESGFEDGVFRSAYRLRDAPDVEPSDRAELAETLKWFRENLETPARFSRTTSKGFYRRNTRGVAWFKDTATEHLSRMHQIKAVLQRYGVSVTMISQSRVGYIVFDDECQVVAEPFKETQTG